MTRATKAEQQTRANKAEHYNAAQARAAERGPMYLLTFWQNLCRKLVKDALENGDPSLAYQLASHLDDFYRTHAP